MKSRLIRKSIKPVELCVTSNEGGQVERRWSFSSTYSSRQVDSFVEVTHDLSLKVRYSEVRNVEGPPQSVFPAWHMGQKQPDF